MATYGSNTTLALDSGVNTSITTSGTTTYTVPAGKVFMGQVRGFGGSGSGDLRINNAVYATLASGATTTLEGLVLGPGNTISVTFGSGTATSASISGALFTNTP